LILDTNALSAFVDGEPAVGTILSGSSRAAIPVIVLGEFRYGIGNSRHRRTYEAWLDVYLRQFEVLPVVEETTVPYAQVRAALKRLGQPIPANDAWIAALAIQHKLPLLSRDQHFDAIPGVQRTGW
jgi:predicted nucleic acid-binding protein